MSSTVWKGHIAFGLVSVPVKLTCAARAESVAFCNLRASDLSRIGERQYAKADGAAVTKDELIKGYEVSKDRYVIVTEEELKSVAPPSLDVAEIIEFIPVSDLDPTYFESAYWLAPDAGGEKAYALLYQGLKSTGYVGIAKITMHRREHILALRAGNHGIAVHTLYYAHEARMTDEYRTDMSRISEQESSLAAHLIQTLSRPFEPGKFRDTYRDNVLALIEAKQAGQAAPIPAKQTKNEPIDILEALKASLGNSTAPGPVAVPSRPRRRKRAGSPGEEAA